MFFDSIPGWMLPGNREKLAELIERCEIRTVIEIGTCYGLSAAWFAQRVERVTCVDLWGAIPCAGVPKNVYELFVRNMEALGVSDRITIVRGDSHSPETLQQVQPADLVYIDGDHTYEGCKKDIEMYGPLALNILCGDDYDPATEDLRGVPKAVDEMLPGRQTFGIFWWLVK